MARMEIKKKELKQRTGFILLTFFAVYLLKPFYDITETIFTTNISQIVFAVIGILITLYVFEF